MVRIKRPMPDTEVLCDRVSPYVRLQDQISTPSDFFFYYS